MKVYFLNKTNIYNMLNWRMYLFILEFTFENYIIFILFARLLIKCIILTLKNVEYQFKQNVQIIQSHHRSMFS